MIELKENELVFTFPEIHPNAKLTIAFQRTLRIPDDDKNYPLPPGLGNFPLRHVDDFSENVPPLWIEHGGIMMPMYQSEALWLHFSCRHIPERATSYPFAIKVAAGKTDAVSGKEWAEGLDGTDQNYMVAPEQPWLDGYCVEKGIIRQFVAMPLGSGYSAEEQITGEAEHGGMQIAVYPMKKEAFERRFPVIPERERRFSALSMRPDFCLLCVEPDMGLAPGGRMKQEIYDDPYGINDWDTEATGRCFVHIANSLVWRAITGANPPHTPVTSKEYNNHGLPWFEYYDDSQTVADGSKILNKLKSVATMGKAKGDVPLPENESVDPHKIVELRTRLKKGQVREGRF